MGSMALRGPTEVMERRGLQDLVTAEHARLVAETRVPREDKADRAQRAFLAAVAERRIPVRPIQARTEIQEQQETEALVVAEVQVGMSVLPIMEEMEETEVLLPVLREVLGALKATMATRAATEPMAVMEQRALQALQAHRGCREVILPVFGHQEHQEVMV